MAYDLSTITVGELLDDPRLLAVLAEEAPGLVGNPLLKLLSDKTVNEALAMAEGAVPPETIAQIRARIATL